MRTRRLFLSTILTLVPAFGHHVVADEFDVSRKIRISGTISNVEFANPHVTFSLDVKNPDGTVTRWKVGTVSPNVLIRNGITKALFAQGTTLVVDAYPAKDGSPRAEGRALTFSDGRQFALRDPGQSACSGPGCITCADCDGYWVRK